VGVEQSLRTLANCTVYQGHGRFVAPHEVQVGDALLAAEWIFINVGGRALVPNLPGLDQVPYLTNSSMMAVDFVPRHLVIVGGSYVGLEFAQMYRRFGSEVTVAEMAQRLVHREDPDVSTAVAEILESEGIGVRVKAECIRLARSGDDCSAICTPYRRRSSVAKSPRPPGFPSGCGALSTARRSGCRGRGCGHNGGGQRSAGAPGGRNKSKATPLRHCTARATD
jgi:pyruvate/2-oxoglutarate dehydrogenase complex dihydrolipoamide dehydrogenase (E3) component